MSADDASVAMVVAACLRSPKAVFVDANENREASRPGIVRTMQDCALPNAAFSQVAESRAVAIALFARDRLPVAP